MTPEEKDFILKIFSQLTIKPTEKDATTVVNLVQSITEKLTTE